MEVLKFLTWWWKKLGVQAKIVILVGLWAQAGVFIAYFFSASIAVAILFGGLGLVGVGLFISGMVKLVKEQWSKYQYEQEREAERIVERLKGYR